MSEESAERKVSYWLQEAKELMVAADLCWRSDALFRQQLADGSLAQVDRHLHDIQLAGEAELNWLYNILAGLAVYYLAIGVLLSRDPDRNFGDYSELRIVGLVEECGVVLGEAQRTFLHRVEGAMAVADRTGQWKVHMEPREMQLLKQHFAEENAVSEADKRAIDDLMSALINTALTAITHEQH